MDIGEKVLYFFLFLSKELIFFPVKSVSVWVNTWSPKTDKSNDTKK